MAVNSKDKNRIGIVLALVLALAGFPVFGQQWYPASGNGNEREPFFSINAQFSWFPDFIQSEGVLTPQEVYPYGVAQAPGYAIQLGMGLKLFNTVNAVFDFGLDDPSMSEAMRIAGKIGTRYFDVVYMYKRTFFPEKTIDSRAVLPAEEYNQWRFPQNGKRLGGKFNVGTLALMGPRFFRAFQFGFIWNSFDANLGFQSEKEIDGRYVAYWDIDRKFNTYGFRLALDLLELYEVYQHILPYNRVLGQMRFIAELYADLSWGNVNLSDEAAAAVGFSEKLMTHSVARGNFGFAWGKKISAGRSITYGLGFDFFITRITVDTTKESSSAVQDPAAFGIFARIGLVL